MNMVAVIGNVASEPKLVEMPSGKVVCTFTIAVERVGESLHDIFEVMTFGREAEVCNNYLYVGRRVGIEGRLLTGSQPGVKIVSNRVQLIGGTN